MTGLIIVTAFLVLDLGVLHTYLTTRPLGQPTAIRRSIAHLVLAWILAAFVGMGLSTIAPLSAWTATAWAIALILPAVLSWALMQLALPLVDNAPPARPRLPRPASGSHLSYGGETLRRS